MIHLMLLIEGIYEVLLMSAYSFSRYGKNKQNYIYGIAKHPLDKITDIWVALFT